LGIEGIKDTILGMAIVGSESSEGSEDISYVVYFLASPCEGVDSLHKKI